jgi:riboflavin synthase
MFSGLIQHKGKVQLNRGNRLEVEIRGYNPKVGDSVAVNGICLTVTKKTGDKNKSNIFFDVSEETLLKTTLKYLSTGALVNIEPALKLSDALGGHIVQGHVDGVGKAKRISKQKDMKTIWFETPKSIISCIVPKGSIAVDGVSLTAVTIRGNQFSVALIPYTLKHTNMGSLKSGDRVNLEADIIGKYISQYLSKK